MANYWTTLQVLNQISGELGLTRTASVSGLVEVQAIQLLALLNSSGNELMLYYPWEQFHKEWVFNTVLDQGDYDLPSDWNYAVDQTQWDRSNHWPLLGPKSAQEWAWLKGGLLSVAPRLRFRIQENKFKLWPVPSDHDTPQPYRIAQEYICRNWVIGVNDVPADMATADGDILMYDPWLLIKFIKMKFYELKGFDTSSVQADFMRIFNALTGKDTGAPILSLAPRPMSQFIGPWSVPDGSWSVGQP